MYNMGINHYEVIRINIVIAGYNLTGISHEI
jgi:hypothetical protein